MIFETFFACGNSLSSVESDDRSSSDKNAFTRMIPEKNHDRITPKGEKEEVSPRNKNNNKLSRVEARIAVKAIKLSVNAMLNESKLMGGTTISERHETFGLFRKGELNLGKLLGRGSFSDVYVIESFSLSSVEDNNGHQFQERQEFVRQQFYSGGNNVTPPVGRYVMKRMRASAAEDPVRFCSAATDLAMESQILCRLNHKNIIKIWGWSSEGIRAYSDGSHDGFFLVLDRVSNTLQERIESWNEQQDELLSVTSSNPSVSSLKTLKNARTNQLKRATNVASQIAAALEYIHSKGVVFRDLKPDNVGFDADGTTVKLLDFGLARELPSDHQTEEDTDDTLYKMSGAVGTQRYAAPEVALGQKYNQKVDTYSWSMLYWSCLTLKTPYGKMDNITHRSFVCKMGRRPYIVDDFPISMEKVLTQSWSQNVATRLTMAQVCQKVKAVETDLGSYKNEELASPESCEDDSYVVDSSMFDSTINLAPLRQ